MIKSFTDLKNEPMNSPYLPPTIVDNIQERMQIKELTPLQLQAFNSDEFWGNENVIVQGATSSGKTLIAEIAAARCIHHSQQEKKVIYLVPLKAMVSEKYNQFRRDMSNNYNWRVCPSSADYQNFDEDILEGNFNIAVIVYEKFFAFLAQNQNDRLLRDCGLLIVDEIQMLSETDRGAKLEFAITKLREDYSRIRIMGLTTIYCDTKGLEAWINAKRIRNIQRSCDLYEHVVMTNGRYKAKLRKKENESNFQDEEGTLRAYENGRRLHNTIWERKTDLLLEIIRQELRAPAENRPANPVKIIVFAHSKRETIRLAEQISTSGILPQRQIGERLWADLGQQDDDEIILKMTQLIQHGVAYHNASLPQGTRVLVENEFEKGSVQVIVATATLAIGLNLPADVIILFDHTVTRDGKELGIEAHAYKNYIGRAGRLGLTNRAGKSFVLTDTQGELNGCWDRYVNAATKEIDSVFSALNASELAPYYLNYIAGSGSKPISNDDLVRFSSATFGRNRHITDSNELGRSILENLKSSKLVEISEEWIDRNVFEGGGRPIEYEITPFGRSLAPFALPLRTSMSIIMYFLQSTKGEQTGGLPDDYCYEDMQNEKYLLDIFYRVCLMEEMEKMAFLQMPNQNKSSYTTIRDAIVNYLGNIAEKDGLWNNSPLFKFLSQPMDTRYETAAMRAMILLHWFRGELPREIKEKTGISLPITIGDLDHLSEVCSYLLESISSCLPKARRLGPKIMAAFHILSIRVKYGLPLAWVRIKNRHVMGITRKNLIKLSRDELMNKYDNPASFIQNARREEWIRYFTPSQREELLRALEEPMIKGGLNSISGNLFDDNLIDESLKESIDELINSPDWDNWNTNVCKVFSALGFELAGTKRTGTYFVNAYDICLYLPQVDSDEMLKIDDYQKINDTVLCSEGKKVIIVCKNGFEGGVLKAFPNDLHRMFCMDNKVFAGLILQSIYAGNGVDNTLLMRALTDLFGEVSGVDTQKLLGTVKNYADSQAAENAGDEARIIYALCDHSGVPEDIKEFQIACKKNEIACKFIQWGGNKFRHLGEIVRAGHPVFVYFSDVRTVQSDYYEYQIQSIISNDLAKNQERRFYILWKSEDIFNAFSERYTYFSQIQGNIKGDRVMEDIVTELKKCMEV